MIEQFLLNQNLMKLVFWFYRHDGEYLAGTIQDDIKLDSFELVKYMHLLDTMEVCKVTPDEDNEELHVKINTDSPLFKSLNDIEIFLDTEMNKSSEIESVLESDETKSLKELLLPDGSLSFEELVSNCKNNEIDEDLDISEEDVMKFLIIFANVFGVE